MISFCQWFDRDKLKEILRTHWESFKETFFRYREDRYDEVVQKMLGCGDPKNGYATYVGGKCGGEQRKFPYSSLLHHKFPLFASSVKITKAKGKSGKSKNLTMPLMGSIMGRIAKFLYVGTGKPILLGSVT